MKRKVLMTASTYGHIRNFHLPYLREFQRLGWETHVGCKGIPTDAPYIDQVIELPFEKKMQSPANFRAARLLQEKIKEENYDLIITHTSLAAFFTRIAARSSTARLINVAHGYLFDDNTPAMKRNILLAAERLTAPQTDLLLTMNQYDYNTAQKYHLGKEIAYIPGVGVDFVKIDHATPEDGTRLRRELRISGEAFVLLYAADLSGGKSQQTLIEALAKLPERAMLVLCGEGPQQAAYESLAARLGLSARVLLPGRVTDMAVWYRMADAAVASSRKEGLPFNVMEAMHMGLPVVASAVKGHTDLIADGETGMLFPCGDADACAAQVQRVMDDAALRETLGVRGRESVERYALDAVLPEVMAKYYLHENNAE